MCHERWCRLRWCRWRRLVSFGVSAISIGRLPSGWYVRLSQTVSVICDGGECLLFVIVCHCLSLVVIGCHLPVMRIYRGKQFSGSPCRHQDLSTPHRALTCARPSCMCPRARTARRFRKSNRPPLPPAAVAFLSFPPPALTRFSSI